MNINLSDSQISYSLTTLYKVGYGMIDKSVEVYPKIEDFSFRKLPDYLVVSFALAKIVDDKLFKIVISNNEFKVNVMTDSRCIFSESLNLPQYKVVISDIEAIESLITSKLKIINKLRFNKWIKLMLNN